MPLVIRLPRKVLEMPERVISTHRIIDHGRALCTARRAYCERCTLAPLCPTAPEAYRTPASISIADAIIGEAAARA